MRNPFIYSGIAEGDAFCNRVEEQNIIAADVKNSQNIVLFSHRKMGKTSLIHKIKNRLEKSRPKIVTVYIDLFGTVTERTFVKALFQGVASLEPKIDKILKRFADLKLSVKSDPVTQGFSVDVTIEPSETEKYLEKCMKILTDYSKKRKLLVVFDEFQEISNYENGIAFEKKLRSYIQLQNNISYIFSGSHRHLLMQMFSSADRAFYQMARNMSLEPIAKSEYISWAMDLFRKGEKAVDEKAVSDIMDRCELQPLAIQQFLYELWETNNVDDLTLDRIEKKILESRKDTFVTIWNSLSVSQKKVLQLVNQTGGTNVYKAENFLKAEIPASGVVQRALNYLVDQQILSKNGGYQFQDVMFKKWILNL
jgi:AAA+ ATPase superfamily predicted ATPase